MQDTVEKGSLFLYVHVPCILMAIVTLNKKDFQK